MLFDSLLPLVVFFPLKVFSLLGGVPLSPGEIARNKYGTGLYPVDVSGTLQICVFLKTDDTTGCIYSTNGHTPVETIASIIIMGNYYTYQTLQPRICFGGADYVNIVSNAPDSLSPRYLSPTAVNTIPPMGTICQMLGFSHIDNGPFIPNKIEVEVMDYQICLINYLPSTLPDPPLRLFCARFKEGGQAQLPFEAMDKLSPIYCPAWKGSEGPTKNLFWPFGKEDQDEEEDENETLIFVGFLYVQKANTIAPLLFESWPCG